MLYYVYSKSKGSETMRALTNQEESELQGSRMLLRVLRGNKERTLYHIEQLNKQVENLNKRIDKEETIVLYLESKENQEGGI